VDKAAADVFADSDTYATCLLALALDRFAVPGAAAAASPVHWTRQTWADEIRDAFGAPAHPRNLDRLMAACALLTHPDQYYQSEAGFGDVTTGLAAEWFDPDVWHPPTTAECLWSVVESYLLDPPDDRKAARFAPAVNAYMTAVSRAEGYPRLPKVFTAFGAADDDSVPAFADYSEDPELHAATAEAIRTKEEDLGGWLTDRLTDLADRVARLPLRSGRQKAVAEELIKSLAGPVGVPR